MVRSLPPRSKGDNGGAALAEAPFRSGHDVCWQGHRFDFGRGARLPLRVDGGVTLLQTTVESIRQDATTERTFPPAMRAAIMINEPGLAASVTS